MKIIASVYKGNSAVFGSGTSEVKVSCFDEDEEEEETILAWMSMSGPTGQAHKQGVMCFRVTGGSDLNEEQPTISTQPAILSQGQPLDVVFAIDNTKSMCQKDFAGVTWLQRTKDEVIPFLDRMAIEAPSTSMAGYVGWNLNYNSIELLTTDLQGLSKRLTELNCHWSGDSSMGGYNGINDCLKLYDATTRPDTIASTKAIIYITDNGTGPDQFVDTCADDGVEVKAKERGITLYTIGYETTVEVGQGLAEMAECTGGFFRRSDGTSITTAKIFKEFYDAINN